MSYAESFAPIAGDDARVLLLGSLPGAESLARGEYYAKPQNSFWRILGDLVGAGPDLAYQARIDRLVVHRIAVWDVCRAAWRKGSLDSAIRSAEVNDFKGFLAAHPAIGLIAFNGRFAETLFLRQVAPLLTPVQRTISTVRLPSTSPAHAGMPYPAKLACWRQALSGAITGAVAER
jgi:hypoxanthine-DNA glycosylase